MRNPAQITIFILSFALFIMAQAFTGRAEKIMPAPDDENAVVEDIDILKTLNTLNLSKEQLKEMIDVVRESAQKRGKTLKEIRAQLVLGKTMDEIPELQEKLKKETGGGMNKIYAVLDGSQKRALELMFSPLPEKEWNEILQLLPKAGQFLSDKRAVGIKLGNKMFSDETLNALIIPLGKAFTELLDWVDAQSQEKFAQKFFTQKTLELLKERLSAMK